MKEIQLYTTELRLRSLFLFFSFCLTIFSLYIYSKEYIFFFVQPLGLRHFIFTNISEAFQASIELSFGCSILLMIPFLFYQIFCFFCPGFFESERKYYKNILLIFILLSLISLVFSYRILLPLISQFFVNFEIQKLGINLQLEARILGSIGFIGKVFVLSEFLFTIPFVSFLLFRAGIFKRDFLVGNRKLCYFAILLVCALICPPDIFFQCVGSGLCILIFEVLIFGGFVQEFYMHELNAETKHSPHTKSGAYSSVG